MGGKIKYHHLPTMLIEKHLGDFYQAVASLNGYDEIKKLLNDLLTTSERVMIARRLQIARMLLSGASYEDIISRLKVGKSNITRVDHWLNQGFGGYRAALKKLDKIDKKKERSKVKISAEEIERMINVNPAHFILFKALFGGKTLRPPKIRKIS